MPLIFQYSEIVYFVTKLLSILIIDVCYGQVTEI